MRPDELIIERKDGEWCLIVLEYSDPDLPDCRNVKVVFAEEYIQDLYPYIDDHEHQIHRINVPIDELPTRLQQVKLRIAHEEQLRYIQDCHQSVHDAEQDLISRKAELKAAIEGKTHV